MLVRKEEKNTQAELNFNIGRTSEIAFISPIGKQAQRDCGLPRIGVNGRAGNVL